MMRITYDEMLREFERVVQHLGFEGEDALRLAQIFADNSLDGVYSHGYNRILHFAAASQRGDIDAAARPTQIASFGAWEQWDGNLGPGPLNALAMTDRVMEMARTHGVGVIGLRNTNHWMRPGRYGWRAAEAGFIFLCWTNTIANMPPWGAAEKRIGNNPIVLAIPRASGPVVLDAAMSQFAFGRLELYHLRGETLPVPGGHDEDDQLTTDAGIILKNERPLPIGYWKGSGLSITLDLIAALMSGGKTTAQLSQHDREFGVSQMYMAFDVRRAHTPEQIDEIVSAALDFTGSARPLRPEETIRYPGESVLKTRAENTAQGIPIDKPIWEKIRAFGRT